MDWTKTIQEIESASIGSDKKKNLLRLIKRNLKSKNKDRYRVLAEKLKKINISAPDWDNDKDSGIVRKNKKFYGIKNVGFLASREWLELRYQVLKKYGRVCMCCGARPEMVHVDHIKPRSKFPELELCFENLQVLCPECNIGKSNKDDTDWRRGVRISLEIKAHDLEKLEKPQG